MKNDEKETLISQNPAYEGFEDRQFETEDHVKLHYMVKGKGDPLVFIPGWSGDSRDFMFNAPYWQKIIKYMCLICGDMATLKRLSWREDCKVIKRFKGIHRCPF